MKSVSWACCASFCVLLHLRTSSRLAVRNLHRPSTAFQVAYLAPPPLCPFSVLHGAFAWSLSFHYYVGRMLSPTSQFCYIVPGLYSNEKWTHKLGAFVF